MWAFVLTCAQSPQGHHAEEQDYLSPTLAHLYAQQLCDAPGSLAASTCASACGRGKCLGSTVSHKSCALAQACGTMLHV